MKVKKNVILIITSIVAILTSLFHIYTGIFGVILTQKIVHLTLIMIIAFLVAFDKNKMSKKNYVRYFYLFFALSALITGSYLSFNYINLINTMGNPSSLEIILGILIVILVLELTRRTMGWPLVIVASLFILYGLLGNYLPGVLKHRGFSISRIVTYLYLTNDGIYGPAISAVANFVMLFVILGAFLKYSGVGEYFIKTADILFSGTRGGPAKAAVVGSCLYGTISGSSTANVVTTGTFTIPLMKSIGYSPEFAGAIEAVASTGGQIMPPIMGSVAFVLAGIVGVGYSEVMKAAIIPAILYYASLFFMVDFRARKLSFNSISVKRSINWKFILKGIYKILPIILIVYLLIIVRLSLMRSAVFTIFATIIISWFDKDWKIGWKKLLSALEDGAKGALIVSSASACAGIVIGMVNLTGLGFRASGIIIEISQGNVIITLILAMVITIIMGMGLPTLASYLIMAVIVAPALIILGIDRLAAHLFIMYFACMSSITPPVALASYAAAGISGGDVWKTGIMGFRLGLVGFIVPYMLVFNHSLMMSGSPLSILQAFLTALLGTYCMASALEKRFLGLEINKITQIILFINTFALIDQRRFSDLIGVFIFVLLIVYRRFFQIIK